MPSVQIPLRLTPGDDPGLECYEPGRNPHVIATLRSLVGHGDPPRLYLWGATGTGVTHLLRATRRNAAEQGLDARYLSLKEARLDDLLIDTLDRARLLCLDDLQVIAGHRPAEEWLFALHNRCLAHGTRLLFGATEPPEQAGFTLPDLVSRLAYAAVFHLDALDEAGRAAALRRHARARGFTLPDETVQWLLTRQRRDLSTLIGLLDRLDEASLAAQRSLTVPFVRESLHE